eukprot:CAMPEP_0172199212 /NCGR_PEP_ID=MMETSP1050-20130122/28551_1 /TAXON_ID=233186 /ORGANISM="Cryptomonas curvata, Strain CCAP979/52" /LENGTH=110 /DNA_ID=CAMNT_0012876187 /DNA_START=236 /DNA_END=564 /DNA_ORIENTATION=-
MASLLISRTASGNPHPTSHSISRTSSINTSDVDAPKPTSSHEGDGNLAIQLFPKTPHDRALWEDFKREMRAVVCRADQSLAEYDASVFAQQEFETQQEQLLAKGRVSTAG